MRCSDDKTHHRILLKLHRCLSLSTPVANKWDYSSDAARKKCEISEGASVVTPDMRVIHAGLVIGQSDEGCVRGPLVNQVQQNLLVVDRQVVHVLWGQRVWGWERLKTLFGLESKWEHSCWCCAAMRRACICGVHVSTHWSRSRNRSPPCPWPASRRSSMAKEGTEETAIWPPGASRRSTDTTSTHTHEPETTQSETVWSDFFKVRSQLAASITQPGKKAVLSSEKKFSWV